MICDSDLTKASINDTRSTNVTLGLETANVSSAQQVVTPRSLKKDEKDFPFFENFNKTAIYTAKSIFQAFSSVVIGPIIDRSGHKVAMYAGTVYLFITAIGRLLLPFCSSLYFYMYEVHSLRSTHIF
ncbi:unnamed protein product [Clavelina lepadiformis]|uniref:Major facilitator superfamily (MFS) profile domain-containing protein n=1 Tax=Clavelina lepadiformis TaxID=159417 RepID=A0ABP0G836_CLALP